MISPTIPQRGQDAATQIGVANWSKRIMRDFALSPALVKSADTVSIPWTSDAPACNAMRSIAGRLDPGQTDALPFWPSVRQR